MKRKWILLVMCVLLLLVVIACAPKQPSVPGIGEEGSSDGTVIDSDLDDLNQLDTLEEIDEDVSFEEVDELLK
ncbi:hypothetical protein HY496_01600 [Candidatus Woesearchaeota archaeon]|nr:hypothetical protein [Candidatus Woesearchaeota archaeon]